MSTSASGKAPSSFVVVDVLEILSMLEAREARLHEQRCDLQSVVDFISQQRAVSIPQREARVERCSAVLGKALQEAGIHIQEDIQPSDGDEECSYEPKVMIGAEEECLTQPSVQLDMEASCSGSVEETLSSNEEDIASGSDTVDIEAHSQTAPPVVNGGRVSWWVILVAGAVGAACVTLVRLKQKGAALSPPLVGEGALLPVSP